MNKALRTLLMLTAMLVAGCNDGTFAPKPEEPLGPQFDGGSSAALTKVDTLRFHFNIDPNKQQTFGLGDGNSITFPRGSVCDLNSSYGTSEWDKPCTPSTTNVSIDTKAWLDLRGNAHLDFSQHVRFVPSSDPANWVKLTFSNKGVATSPWGGKILYCVTETGCIDESHDDPTLLTVTDPVSGKITRRIKHFSGYSLTSGRDDAASLSEVGITLLKP